GAVPAFSWNFRPCSPRALFESDERLGVVMTLRFAAILAALMIAGCSSNPPVAQLQSFSDAYKSANDAGQPLLDDLAVAERSQGQINAATQAGRPIPGGDALDANPQAACPRSEQQWRAVGTDMGFLQGYCVSDAAYFASLGEPPATQSFRGGLAVLGKYV